MTERIEGNGEVECWEQPERRTPVHYLFDITTRILDKPGYPPVVAGRRSRGDIRPLAGEDFVEGYYRLYASDGEILKVKNLGFTWVILAS